MKITPARRPHMLTSVQDIQTWLDDVGLSLGAVIDSESLTVKLNKDASLCYLHIPYLPVNFSETKTLRITDCGLLSLEGSPRLVKGDFKINNNHLMDLSFAPKKIKGILQCSHNHLTSLCGLRQTEIGGGIYCQNNRLTSLAELPRQINGELDIANNPLRNLNGVNSKIASQAQIFFGNTHIAEFKNLTKEVTNRQENQIFGDEWNALIDKMELEKAMVHMTAPGLIKNSGATSKI